MTISCKSEQQSLRMCVCVCLCDFGLQYLAQGHLHNKQPSDYKTLALPLSRAVLLPPCFPLVIPVTSLDCWTAGPLLLPEIWQGVYSSTQQVVSWLTQQIRRS